MVLNLQNLNMNYVDINNIIEKFSIGKRKYEEKKAKYDEWQAKWFIESVWCFRKPDPSNDNVDIFAPYKDSTLDGMGPIVVQQPIKKKKVSEASTEKSTLMGFID